MTMTSMTSLHLMYRRYGTLQGGLCGRPCSIDDSSAEILSANVTKSDARLIMRQFFSALRRRLADPLSGVGMPVS